jgi:hypothetical protein
MGGVVPVAPPGSAYGTPYAGTMPMGSSLMLDTYGSQYGTPRFDGYAPSLARSHSLRSGSVFDDDYYGRDRYYDRDRDYDYERDRRYYDDDDYVYARSSSRASRRDYDYPGYEYERDYYDDRYGSRYHDDRYRSSRRYPSSSRYYSSSSRSSGRRREDMSIITKRNGEVKVLRNGEERIGDRLRRMVGMDPKGVNVVRLKPGESLAANIRR